MSALPQGFLQAFDALPAGTGEGLFEGRRFRYAKTRFSSGASHKLEAWELGGPGYISFNLYRLQSGHSLLRPCEMSAETVTGFVLGLRAAEPA